MLKNIIFTLSFLLSLALQAQVESSPAGLQSISLNNGLSPTTAYPKNGNGVLGNSYKKTLCGLQYTTASNRLGTRYAPAGVAQPATFAIVGIPANATIDKAYIWFTVSGTGLPVNLSIINPQNDTAIIPAALIGSGPDKCWGYAGTHSYRADLTPMVAGNGSYQISGFPTSLTTPGDDTDGATMMVIYADPTANYQASLIIDDGTIVTPTNSSHIMAVDACSNSTYAEGMAMLGDLQISSTATFNGSLPFAVGSNNSFWDFATQAVTIVSGQPTTSFTFTTNDCHVLAVAGLYYRFGTCGPLTTITSSTPSPCNDSLGTATVTPSGGTTPYSYLWSSDPTQSTQTATNLPPGTFYVWVNDSAGCSSSVDSATVSFPPFPATPTQINVSCKGLSDGSAKVSPDTSGALTFTWNPNVSSDSIATGLSAGSYTVTVTDTITCATSNYTFLITEPDSILIVSQKTDVLCFGDSTGSIHTSVTGGTTPYSYSWTPSVSTADSAINLPEGTFIVQVTDSNGCQITDTISIAQPDPLILTLTLVHVDCATDSTGSAIATVSGGVEPYTYTWDPVVSTSDTALDLPAGSYELVVTDSNLCTIDSIFQINESSPITSVTTKTDVLCAGDSTGTGQVTPSGGVAPYQYLWSTGATSASVTGLPAGTHYVQITDSLGCSGSDSVIITEPPPIQISTTIVAATCGLPNGSASASATGGTPIYTYSWNSTPVQTTDTATALAPGSYTVTVTDAQNCSDTTSVTIPDTPGPTGATDTIINPSCFGSSDGSASIVITAGTPPVNATWNTTPPQTGLSASGLSSGTYEVLLVDSNQCTDTLFITLTDPPEITITSFAHKDTLCPSDSTIVGATASGGAGEPFTFVWNQGLSGLNAHTVSPTSPTTYIVYAIDSNGCESSHDTIQVHVYPPFSASISPSVEICRGEGTTLTASGTGGSGTYTYTWSPGGASTASIDVTPSTTTTYQVVVTDLCGADTLESTITVNEPATAVAGNDTTIIIGGSANLFASGGVEYFWFPSTGLSSPTSANPTASPEVTTTYVVKVTTANGCFDFDTVTVTVEIKSDVFVPDAFSPNGDGANDVLYVRGTAIESMLFRVFDRWGHLVFESKDPAVGWDGSVRGQARNTGVYVYFLEVTFLTGATEILKGDVSLIR